jgi:hypothetical protein
MKGVLLIALGHPAYMHMAEALAASIRVNDPGLLICVATDGSPSIDITLFDRSVIVPEKYYTEKGRTEYIKAKLFMYNLSPFTETIFLDVDQIVLEGRRITDLFQELQGVDVTFSNTGPAGMSIWVDMVEVAEKYGAAPFWNYHSELVFFRKGDTAKRYFKVAQKAYSAGILKSAFAFSGATMADELAFQLAAMQTGIYPHKENWLPNFWHRRHKEMAHFPAYKLKGQYFTYSLGGSNVPPYVAANYNNLAAFYYSRLGLRNPYKAKDKSSFIPERSKI